MEWRRDGYLISTDPARLDREEIWRFQRAAYWSPERFGFEPADPDRMMDRKSRAR
jgi:hypothetical protein